MQQKVEILNMKIDNVNMEQAVERINSCIKEAAGSKFVATPNSEMLVRAYKDPDFAKILEKADLLVPDGAGLILASRLLNRPLQERVAGYDLMNRLLGLASKQGYTIYLLGGKPGIIDRAYSQILKRYPGINICGKHHGYFDNTGRKEVIESINKTKPDILFVGLGVPLQEKFISNYLSRIQVKVAMTVGGSFDVLAGEVKRAPLWMQKIHLEWFYRLLKEPSRIGRMLALPEFVRLIIMKKITG